MFFNLYTSRHKTLDLKVSGASLRDLSPKQGRREVLIEKNVDWGTGADPGFLERGFICIKVWGLALLIFSHFSLYPMKMK